MADKIAGTMNPNRAMLLTAPGVAAIAVVRIAGPAVGAFLGKYFSRPLAPSRAIHGILRRETGEQIDDPVVVLSPDGQSADVNLHGGAWVVRAVLDLSKREGFEVVERLESPLPDDAIDAADTIEREVLAYLPLATTELALRTLLAQERAWKSLEARLRDPHPGPLPEYRERELISPSPGTPGEGWGEGLLQREEIDAILKDRSLHWLLHPPRVAIVGAANVGKSTLANQLFAQERSITADVPGTTRDWVGEMANLDGLAVQLVDTPGIRDTVDSIEREAIERAGTQIERADLVVLVLDASQTLEPEQATLMARFPNALRVVNKIDAPRAWDIRSIDAIPTVATSAHGVDDLMRRIRRHFGCEGIDPNRARCWTERQKTQLTTLNVQRPTSTD